jgi:hypothetical protein
LALRHKDKVLALTSERDWGDVDADLEARELEVEDEGNILPPNPEPEVEPEPEFEPEPEANAEPIAAEPEGDGELDEPSVDPALEALKRESEGRLRALIEARQEKALLQQREAEYREEMQRIRLEAEEATKAAAPDPELDGVGYVENVIDERTKTLDEKLDRLEQSLEQDRLREDMVNTAQIASVYENAYAQEHPDYTEAFNVVKNGYLNAYIEAGYSPEQANAFITYLGYQASRNALAVGENPAQIIYDEAVNRFGYQAKEKVAPVAPEPTPNTKPRRTSLSEPGFAGAGNTPGSRKGEMDRKYIFESLPKDKRQKIFMNDDLNKQLAETGKVTIPADFFE